MAFSSLQNFIRIPTSLISIPNSKNLNAAASFHTTINNSYLPPQLLSTKRRRPAASLCIQCHGGGFFSMDDDDSSDNEGPLETINKVYKSIKKKDVAKLANVIADQRPDIVDSIPFLRTRLKMRKLASHIIKGLQENLVFSIQPTTKDGSMVGIIWKKLEDAIGSSSSTHANENDEMERGAKVKNEKSCIFVFEFIPTLRLSFLSSIFYSLIFGLQ
ncbi:uncharacterized protein LOC105435947 isoform X2 [Cucumis sativus]|uniref:uncharacterized protein LOC105435947 isoform X2 n=1 Tax=Cucumis sativus TaxID=3659 RepID=UPI0005ED01EA|nr:uncharacterized protein LOC105435947 isoform X2 [Cucumis sativus]